MKIIEDMGDLEQLNDLIATVTVRLKLEVQLPPDHVWFASCWTMEEWKSALREVCLHNNQVYAEMLAETVIVSEFVAYNLAVEQSNFHRNMKALDDQSAADDSKETINAWTSIIGAFVNPINIFKPFLQMIRVTKKQGIIDRKKETLAEELSPVLWSYLLTADGKRFVLKRGKWDDISDDGFLRAAVINVGISPVIVGYFTAVPKRPKLDIAIVNSGREGMTCTESYFNPFTPRPPF